jgi:hypothetical protein
MKERVAEAITTGLDATGGGDVRVTIATAGRTRDGARYYQPAGLADAAARNAFDGVKMYVNHRDRAEVARRGHRDVRDWAATILPGSVRYADGELTGTAHPHSPNVRALLRDSVARENIGLSADWTVEHARGEAPDGKPAQMVSRIATVHSVDFVPDGNARGRIAEAFENIREAATDFDVAHLRTIMQKYGVPADQQQAMIDARQPGGADDFAERARRFGVRDPREIERLRKAR